MIFTFIKYLVLGILCTPVILLLFFFILLVPATYRKYWAGWADVNHFDVWEVEYCWQRKTILWRLAVLSLNLGYPNNTGAGLWEIQRHKWLEKKGFKKECSWIGDLEEDNA